jgi:hypothetical protein
VIYGLWRLFISIRTVWSCLMSVASVCSCVRLLVTGHISVVDHPPAFYLFFHQNLYDNIIIRLQVSYTVNIPASISSIHLPQDLMKNIFPHTACQSMRDALRKLYRSSPPFPSALPLDPDTTLHESSATRFRRR